MLFLGYGDNLANYDEITEAEYRRILAEQEAEAQKNRAQHFA